MLSRLPALAALDVSESSLRAPFDFVTGMPALTTLRADGCLASRLGLDLGCGATRLVRLSLRSSGITDRRVACVRKLPSLRELDVSDNDLESNEGFAAHLPALQRLDVSGNSLRGVAPPASLHTLRCGFQKGLRLHNCALPCPASSSGIHHLDVSRSRLSDAHLRAFAQLPALRTLDLRNCLYVDDGTVKALDASPRLRTVLVSGTRCTAATTGHELANAGRAILHPTPALNPKPGPKM
jgi:Leucine-rich repeat (LRR) protein